MALIAIIVLGLGAFVAFVKRDNLRQLQAPHGSYDSASVFPASAQGLEPVELSKLVSIIIHGKEFQKLRWDFLSTAPSIKWLTDGYENHGGELSSRNGLVRLRVKGKASTALRQKVDELAWTISLQTDGPPTFGPQYISISPGFEDALGNEDCFGTLYDGCEFKPADIIGANGLSAQLICKSESAQERKQVFILKAEDKTAAVMVYMDGGGSGGWSSSIAIYPMPVQAGLCKI